MATLGKYTFAQLAQVALLPVSGDAEKQALSSSTRFGPFAPGDSLVVACDAPFNVLAGDSAVVALTSSPWLAANVYKFSLPDGCTHVALLSATGYGQVYKG